MFEGKRPKNIGIKKNRLAICPASPNCVSSQGHSNKSYIKPFTFKASFKSEIEMLKIIVEHQQGMTIIISCDDYFHAECKTPIMGFVDDLEFYWDPNEEICHVRSASRLGHSDFGKNRSRVERLRTLFDA